MANGTKRREAARRDAAADAAPAPLAPGDAAARIDMAVALARCRAELDDARAELDRARVELELRTREIVQLTRICRRHEAEAAALRASTSWRLTWPLRRAITLVRPKRRAGPPRPPEAPAEPESGEAS